MHKIILADNQAIFRTGTAKVLAMEDDLRIIAQCPDCPRLYHALTTFRGAIVIVASSMGPDLNRIIIRPRSAASRPILVAENAALPPTAGLTELRGRLYRNGSSAGQI